MSFDVILLGTAVIYPLMFHLVNNVLVNVYVISRLPDFGVGVPLSASNKYSRKMKAMPEYKVLA
jgi:hypothetical protein